MEKKIKVGDVLNVRVIKITNFGAFVRLPNKKDGLIHISQIAPDFVKDINEHLKLGDQVKARVIRIKKGKIALSLKNMENNKALPKSGFRSSVLQEKLEAFLNTSIKKKQ